MKITKVANYHDMSVMGAEIIYNAVVTGLLQKGYYNLGLATGNTMIELYELLANKLNSNNIDLSGLQTWNLDEYAMDENTAAAHDHPLSYYSYMHKNLFSRFDAARNFNADKQAHFPDPADPAGFDAALEKSGGLDLQLLGIGFNGHIAFNEPESADSISVEAYGALPTRVLPLTQETIDQNTKVTANGDSTLVPHFAATMGMKPILNAQTELLLACFAEQEAPLSKMLEDGKATPELPASYLLAHKDFTLIYTADKINLDKYL